MGRPAKLNTFIDLTYNFSDDNYWRIICRKKDYPEINRWLRYLGYWINTLQTLEDSEEDKEIRVVTFHVPFNIKKRLIKKQIKAINKTVKIEEYCSGGYLKGERLEAGWYETLNTSRQIVSPIKTIDD